VNVNERCEQIAKLDLAVDEGHESVEQHAAESVKLAALAHFSDDPVAALKDLRDEANMLVAAAEALIRHHRERDGLTAEQNAWERTAAGR
jgi:hypothetical protein